MSARIIEKPTTLDARILAFGLRAGEISRYKFESCLKGVNRPLVFSLDTEDNESTTRILRKRWLIQKLATLFIEARPGANRRGSRVWIEQF